MKEKYMVFISRTDIKRYTIKLGNRQIILDERNRCYYTDDPDEVKYLINQKGLGVRKVTDREYRYLQQTPVHKRPFVTNRDFTKEESKEFQFVTPDEVEMVKILKEKGYTISEPSDPAAASKKKEVDYKALTARKEANKAKQSSKKKR